MTEPRAPKKSEVLEVRIPYPTKTAFMEKARAEGIAASEIVRRSIDRYLEEDDQPLGLADRAAQFFRRNARGLGLLLAGAGSAAAITLAVSPATALPDLKAAFSTLDANGDGLMSLDEFATPQAALPIDIQAAATLSAASVPIAAPDATGANLVRFMLDAGTPGGVLPLMVMIDVPQGGMTEADLVSLIGKAFAGLDKDGDGRLTLGEFSAG